ncbi:hypothetical protein MLD38_032567 [Melastoma candidum]|uniref:Uncharacterized protein n=1 Tax=Melastoma candidum TaxID=119954 RepID=A0ACB9M440_9MYRT|nr:hypothetical protein MLD38_032567 [Melastoma candidum]
MADSGGVVGVAGSNCGTSGLKSRLCCKDRVLERCRTGDDDGVVILEPVTPDTAKDGVDATSLGVSPLILPENVSEVACGLLLMGDDDGGQGSVCVDNGSPHTPKGSVFNPLGGEEGDALQATHSKKLLDAISGRVAQHLNFGCPIVEMEDGTQATDEDIVEWVYKNLLEAIALLQAEEILACVSSPGIVLSGCKTPTLLPLLNGIADTCPGAPVKRSMKSRFVDWGLRRKLEF